VPSTLVYLIIIYPLPPFQLPAADTHTETVTDNLDYSLGLVTKIQVPCVWEGGGRIFIWCFVHFLSAARNFFFLNYLAK
jgi:hypothetical protein